MADQNAVQKNSVSHVLESVVVRSPEELATALRDRKPGGTIRLEPGSYALDTVILQEIARAAVDVEGVGGRPEDCMLEVVGGAALCLQAGSRLKKLSVFSGGSAHPVISIEGSSVLLKVKVRGNGSSGLRVAGEKNRTSLHECHMEDNRELGLLIEKGACVMLRECVIARSGTNGALIQDPGTAVEFSSCRITDQNSGLGIKVGVGARVELKSSQIARNKFHAIQFGGGPDALLRVADCEVGPQSADGSGVVVHSGSIAEVDCTTFNGNGQDGIAAIGGCSVTVRDCTVQGSGRYGINIASNSRLTLIGGQVNACAAAGVGIHSQSLLSASKVKMEANQVALDFEGASQGELTEIEIRASVKAGVQLRGGARVNGSRCVFNSQKGGAGVLVVGRSELEVTDCDFSENHEGGIAILDESRAQVRGCAFHHHPVVGSVDFGIGAFVRSSSSAQFHDCRFFENGITGARIDGAAQARFVGCEFRQNGYYGFAVSLGASVSLERCTSSHHTGGEFFKDESAKVSFAEGSGFKGG